MVRRVQIWHSCWKSRMVLEGTMNAERYYKGFRATYAPLQTMCFQQDNAKPHTAAITTAWFRSRRVQVLNWPACSPDISPIENIWHIIKWKISKRWSRTVRQLETYIRARMGPNSNTKTPENHNLDARTSSKCFEKKRCYTMVNIPPSQLFWDLYSKTQNSFCVHFQFKHLLCYLCSIVNKILAHVIWKSFSFHFIQIKTKNVPTFLEFRSNYFKGIMTWEIKIPLIFWYIRGHCTIKTSRKFQN